MEFSSLSEVRRESSTKFWRMKIHSNSFWQIFDGKLFLHRFMIPYWKAKLLKKSNKYTEKFSTDRILCGKSKINLETWPPNLWITTQKKQRIPDEFLSQIINTYLPNTYSFPLDSPLPKSTKLLSLVFFSQNRLPLS